MGMYNCEDTLTEAIDSILNQTFDDWELILCDDGSSDATLQVASLYSKKYEKIKIYRNDRNMGLNYTLNKCLQYAQGLYIARMDSDDISLPDRFEKEVNFLDNNNEYAIVSTRMIYFDEKGEFGVGNGSGEVNITTFYRGTPFAHATVMVRREAYESVGGYNIGSKYLRVEDWDLWIRMYLNGYKGYILPEALYKMRDDRNAINRRKFKYRLNEMRVCIFAIRKFRLSYLNYLYALRFPIVGLLPKSFYKILHKKKLINKK